MRIGSSGTVEAPHLHYPYAYPFTVGATSVTSHSTGSSGGSMSCRWEVLHGTQLAGELKQDQLSNGAVPSCCCFYYAV